MINENSGLIFRIPLAHNLGFGFGQLLDFTDEDDFNGLNIVVYDLLIDAGDDMPTLQEIEKSKKLLGPFILSRIPSVRGKDAWKKIGATKSLFYEEIPDVKEFIGLLHKNDNWAESKNWRIYSENNGWSDVLPYHEVRNYETSIVTSNTGVAEKLTMYRVITDGKDLSAFYNLNDVGTKNLFVELINTYFDEKTCVKLLAQYL